MRTCQQMGIQTVAVYSEADMQALHTEMADESYFIGSSPARQSYLNAQKIIDVAKAAGARAIHPGYGFLSENADFAAAVQAADLTFIGPSAPVIRLMGDKLQAKSMARQAHVSMIPGSEAHITTKEEVRLLAFQLGYPLLLKAAAGGGGKGMRVIYSEDQIDEALHLTSSEALSSFGDGRVFVEKYVEASRHIEIQVLGDSYGNIVHLGERDCSLQRRHQKVIEETPSPFMTPDLRQAMTAQAIALARQVKYTSAGTVEFIVTSDSSFYFLEMNTRLQVEHPVTEMVTGIDIVEQMIRIAAGEPLSFTQSDVSFSGHAMEARLYAEDADHDFMPCSGRITRFEPFVAEVGLRLDTGIEPGADVSIFYDPMLAKLISWAPNRLEAIQRLQRALAKMTLEGPIHNSGFLEQLLLHPKVIEGNYTTHFIEKEKTLALPQNQKRLIKAVAALIHHRANGAGLSAKWVVVEGGKGTCVSLEDNSIVVEDEVLDLDLHWYSRERHFVVTLHGQSYYGQVRLMVMGLTLNLFGREHSLQVMPPKVWNLYAHVQSADSLPDNLIVKAPMPGTLIALPVSVGERVKLGQTLLVIEAMKMENALKSPAEATVMDILVQPGDNLARNQVLVKLG
jgi:propionyl-CoA carboxylase alpha chain